MKFRPGDTIRKGNEQATVIHSAPPEKGRKRVVVVVGDEGAEVWYEDECEAVNDGDS